MKTTKSEIAVLEKLFESASGNGHDFGLIEDAREAVPTKSLAGVVSSLVKKGLIQVHEAVNNGEEVWTQFTWKEGAKEIVANLLAAKKAVTELPKEVEAKVKAEVTAHMEKLAANDAPTPAPKAKKAYKKPAVKTTEDGIPLEDIEAANEETARLEEANAVAAELEKKATVTATVEVKDEPRDFLMFVGGSFYTKEDFISEAKSQGISKRLPSFHIPGDLKVGVSKIWLAAGASRKMGEVKAEEEESKKPHPVVFGYFVPEAIEFIAGPEGEKTYADIIAAMKTVEGARIVGDTSTEKPRKCGMRKVGGTYVVTGKEGKSPLVETPEQAYNGNHFRGMMRLSAEHAAALEKGEGIATLVGDSCMVCFEDFLTSKDSATRAARERRRIEKGEMPKWLLTCPGCTKKARDEKRAAKKTPATVAAAEATPGAVAEVNGEVIAAS